MTKTITKTVAKAARVPAKKLTAKQLEAALQAKLDADGQGATEKQSQAAARKAVAKAAPKPKVDPDAITYVGPDKSMKDKTAGKMLVKAGDTEIHIDGDKLSKVIGKLAVIGGSLAALEDHLAKNGGKTKLANGVTAQNAPHSAKAVADSAKAPAKAPAKRTARPAASTDTDATITATEKGAAKIAKAGPKDRLAVMVSSGTVAKALEHMKQADINYAARCGLITIG